MFNFLIVEDNVLQCEQLVNFISTKVSNIRLYYMAHSAQEAIDIINKEIVDIILLDLKLPDMSGIEIINEIENNKIEKYINSIILITGESKMLFQVLNSPYINNYFVKPANLLEISNSINKIMEQKKLDNNANMILEKINNELSILNFNFSYVGTRYLKECIYELYIRKDENLANLSKEIYPIIAKKYNKSVNNIYSNIKQSIKIMYYDCDSIVLTHYFNYSYCVQPKAKEIIFTILNKL